MKRLAIGCLIVASLSGCDKPSTSGAQPASTGVAPAAASGATAGAQLAPAPIAEEKAPESSWTYNEDRDQMRGTMQYSAFTVSSNELNLPFPYQGGSHLMIAIRKTAEGHTEAFMAIKKGQLTCGYPGCEATVKFDDHAISKVSLSPAAGGATEAAFLNNAPDFIKRIRSSKKLIVELAIYDAGLQQFTFDTAGLKWDH